MSVERDGDGDDEEQEADRLEIDWDKGEVNLPPRGNLPLPTLKRLLREYVTVLYRK